MSERHVNFEKLYPISIFTSTFINALMRYQAFSSSFNLKYPNIKLLFCSRKVDERSSFLALTFRSEIKAGLPKDQGLATRTNGVRGPAQPMACYYLATIFGMELQPIWFHRASSQPRCRCFDEETTSELRESSFISFLSLHVSKQDLIIALQHYAWLTNETSPFFTGCLTARTYFGPHEHSPYNQATDIQKKGQQHEQR